MSNIWDCFTPIRGLIHGLNDRPGANSQRRPVRLQLEQLEKREVLSADAATQSIDVNQYYQQLLQAEANPTASQAPFLQQSLTAATMVLPTYSHFLNTASNDMIASFGSQLGQQYMQIGLQQVNSFLLNLEDATLSALNASGDFQDPTFLSDATAVNAFMNNPLNYSPPV